MITELEIYSANILIVDDQESNIILLDQLLSEAGYTSVTSTMRPEDVADLHHKNHYDLILLDLLMPVMDGFEVMQALKLDKDNFYLPVLVLTAQSNHKLRALQSGAKDFISKPFDLLEVKTRIHNMLEVRLLYKKLDDYNKVLVQTVMERTEELRKSEARYRSLTELATDWYWEQDANMFFTKISGPVREVLGIPIDTLVNASDGTIVSSETTNTTNMNGWNEAEQKVLQAKIASRLPFLNLVIHHTNNNGTQTKYLVSGEPMFDRNCRFTGYRGVGLEMTTQILNTAVGR